LGELKDADVVVGAVYVTGAKAPKLISRDLLRQMRPGSVLVDVSIDQGGIAETSRPTKLHDPVFVEEGVLHYCVSNMPGAFPRTSTFALTNTTLPYVLELANKGSSALEEDLVLQTGLNLFRGKVTNRAVAEVFNLEYTPPSMIDFRSQSEDSI